VGHQQPFALVAAFPLSRVERMANSPQVREELLTGTEHRYIFAGSESDIASVARIEKPTGVKRFPDRFYAEVVHAIAELRLRGVKAPVEMIAETNGFRVRTIHRWVDEARRRGLVPTQPRWEEEEEE
jgi:hypothetical protein